MIPDSVAVAGGAPQISPHQPTAADAGQAGVWTGGVFLQELFVDRAGIGVVAAAIFIFALAEEFGMDLVDLTDMKVEADVLKAMPLMPPPLMVCCWW